MPRHYEIDSAWRASIKREPNGRQTVTTEAFVSQHLLQLTVTDAVFAVPAYGPQNDVTLKMPAFEWVHVQLHQQKGMISLSPPTICNSAIKGNLCAEGQVCGG